MDKAKATREKIIGELAELLRTTSFRVEYKVKKKPRGIIITHELTQEEMDAIVEAVARRKEEE